LAHHSVCLSSRLSCILAHREAQRGFSSAACHVRWDPSEGVRAFAGGDYGNPQARLLGSYCGQISPRVEGMQKGSFSERVSAASGECSSVQENPRAITGLLKMCYIPASVVS